MMDQLMTDRVAKAAGLLDEIRYETTADDGCRLAHVVEWGHQWTLVDPDAAFASAIAKIIKWQTWALAWHDTQYVHEKSA